MTNFSVEMFKNIEREINEFITYNTIQPRLNVKHALLNVVDKIRNSPKFLIDIHNEEELHKKTVLFMKKYILDTSSSDTTHNIPVEEIAKVIILDSKNAHLNNEWNNFVFDEELHTKNLNLECLIVKSKDKLDGPHVHIRCKQMARSTILTEKNIKDYHTSLVLTRILTLGDIFYYHYQPIKSNSHSSDIPLVLTNLDLQVIDSNNKTLKFKDRIDNLRWNVDYDANVIEVHSHLEEIRKLSSIYAVDTSSKSKYYLTIKSDQNDTITLKADDTNPLDKESLLENNLFSDVNSSTLYFTYN